MTADYEPGVAIGKRTYRGAVVEGTEEAIREEMEAAFVAMDGDEGESTGDGLKRSDGRLKGRGRRVGGVGRR